MTFRFSFYLLSTAAVVSAAWTSETPYAPPRWKSKLLGLPTWITPITDYDSDTFNTTTIFSVVVMLVSTTYAMHRVRQLHQSSPQGNLPLVSTIGRFNYIILSYLVSTCIASFTFAFMNAGKVWASFGVFHNLLEMAMLITMITQSPTHDRVAVPFAFLYLIVTMAVVIVAPWPLDALFFKFQGLISDIALSINFWRLYLCNRRAMKALPLVTEKDHVPLPVHHHLVILCWAATFHAFGNLLVTVGNYFLSWVIFQYLYAIAFPMYAYYCVMEPTGNRIKWYEPSLSSEALVLLISTMISTGSILIGVLTSVMATYSWP
ncbi:hypothetical protein DM01DRAFT_1331014 [Hesseltinella vesiculosa]|uniref:Uncharacterized protein n=1 Tax=Hesseltinella vesiculosa TaxID=101127 RepID=A0A1X2GXU3_9FUNG|nr:hypothetical protein DM01DRAFT_1331014 [Hesseltinella vesiculosa]